MLLLYCCVNYLSLSHSLSISVVDLARIWIRWRITVSFRNIIVNALMRPRASVYALYIHVGMARARVCSYTSLSFSFHSSRRRVGKYYGWQRVRGYIPTPLRKNRRTTRGNTVHCTRLTCYLSLFFFFSLSIFFFFYFFLVARTNTDNRGGEKRNASTHRMRWPICKMCQCLYYP